MRRPNRLTRTCKSSPLHPSCEDDLRNLITDVAGASAATPRICGLGSGATAVIFDRPAVGAIDLRGGAPGTRGTALLDPAQTVEGIDAITLSGGSAFGLDAASGVQAWLKEQGRGSCRRRRRACRSCRRRSCSISTTAATRSGDGFRRIASSAMRRRPALPPISASVASGPARRHDGQLQRRDRVRGGAECRRAVVGALAAVNAAGSVLI